MAATRTCDNCGSTFPIQLVIEGKPRILNRRRYCLECSPFGRHNTRRLHRKRLARACGGCGAKTLNPKFCSNQCQRNNEWQSVKGAIAVSGEIRVGRSGQSHFAKRYLLETRGRRCEICGGTEWRGQPMPLVLDHMDGRADNWAVANLRLICGNCDMQLPTYKSRNRGQGRAWRRQRYAEGKSY